MFYVIISFINTILDASSRTKFEPEERKIAMFVQKSMYGDLLEAAFLDKGGYQSQ